MLSKKIGLRLDSSTFICVLSLLVGIMDAWSTHQLIQMVPTLTSVTSSVIAKYRRDTNRFQTNKRDDKDIIELGMVLRRGRLQSPCSWRQHRGSTSLDTSNRQCT